MLMVQLKACYDSSTFNSFQLPEILWRHLSQIKSGSITQMDTFQVDNKRNLKNKTEVLEKTLELT